MSRKSYILLGGILGLLAMRGAAYAEDKPPTTTPLANKMAPRLDNDRNGSKSRLYEQAGLGFYDGSFEATGKIQSDKFYEFVHQSTPTTPASNHAREWLDNNQQKLCVRFDDGTSSCLGPGTSGGGGTLSGALYPIYYNSGSNVVYASTSVALVEDNLTFRGNDTFTGSTVFTGVTTLSTSTFTGLVTMSTFTASSGTVSGDLYVNRLGLTSGTGFVQAIGGSIGLFNNTGNIFVTPQTNGRFSLSQGSTLTLVSGDGLGYVGLRSSDSVSTTVWTLPRSKGIAGQSMMTDSQNNLFFATPTTGSVNAGTINELAYYASSSNTVSETGVNLTWDSGSHTLSVGKNDGTSRGDLYLGEASGTSGSLVFGHGTGVASLVRAANPGSDQIYTIPALLSSSFVMTEGAQTINGNKVITGSTNLTGTTTATSSVTLTSPNGTYNTYNISAGSITARNIASGTQCVQADGSGNLTGTGASCGAGTGEATLSSTQTWTGGNVFQGYTNLAGSTTVTGLNGTFIGLGHNRIINGDFVIDQRNEGALVTPVAAGTYGADKWKAYNQSAAQFKTQRISTTPPTGFKFYTHVTVTTAILSPATTDVFILVQWLEGYNVKDFGFGTSAANPVSISFWVKSTQTGQMAASLSNGAGDRSYPFIYTMNATNTWEKKTLTLAGDTTGTWPVDNTAGMFIIFDLGSGSAVQGSSNTWQTGPKYSVAGSTRPLNSTANIWDITGVQVEIGSTATSFEFTPMPLQLMQCQRYYEKSWGLGTAVGSAASAASVQDVAMVQLAATTTFGPVWFKTEKKSAPTVVSYDATGASGKITTFSVAGAQTNGRTAVLFNAGFKGFSIEETAALDYLGEINWTADADF